MKFNYYSDTDSLYIDLSEKESVDSREISAGIVADFDAEGNIVGLDIEDASKHTRLDDMTFSGFTPHLETHAGAE